MIDVLLPHPELSPFIRAYIHNLIDFSTGGINQSYYFTPTHKKFIMLYLGYSVNVTFDNGKSETKKDMLIIGPQTKPVSLFFEQSHRLIAIELQNTGQFYLLDGCPIHTIMDGNIDGDAVFGNKVNELTERLTATLCRQEIKNLLDTFFLHKLSGAANATDRIDSLLNKIPENQRIADIATSAGISLRQLERHYKEKIGMPPRFYNKLRRFADAYKLKELNPGRSWTDIAYTCGYFDQMHLIRDFRLFSGHNPRFLNQLFNSQYQEYTNYKVPEDLNFTNK